MLETRIYQCFHDHGSKPENKYISRIRPALLCGAALEDRGTEDITGCLRDNTGDNISAENLQYSELTGYYWSWKNDSNVDIIGIEHYRRHFIRHSSKIDDYVSPDDLLTEKQIINYLMNYDFIIPVHESLANTSVYDLYVICFGKDQADEIVKYMRDFFTKSYEPEFVDSLYKYMSENWLTRANMLITTKREFDAYCGIMFRMIDYLKVRMKTAKPESRVWGYVTELFPMIYIRATNSSFVECDVAIDDFNLDIQKKVVHTTQHNKEEDFSQKNPADQIEYFKSL